MHLLMYVQGDRQCPELALLDVHAGRILKELDNSGVIEVAITGNVGSGVYLVGNGTGKRGVFNSWAASMIRSKSFCMYFNAKAVGRVTYSTELGSFSGREQFHSVQN